jgi:HSP20 family protein
MANIVKRENQGVARGAAGQRWDPFRAMDALLRWDPFDDGLRGFGRGDFMPRFELKETKEAYVVNADLPGVKEADLEVALNGNLLSVKGQREEEHHEEGESFYTSERSYGSFARTFTLPDSVDSEHVDANLKDGVLTVRVPKRPEAQPKRIPIGSRNEGGNGNDGNAKA